MLGLKRDYLKTLFLNFMMLGLLIMMGYFDNIPIQDNK
jgi:hypothetical protein